MKKYSIAIAGTTKYTKMCAETLSENNNFEILWILTPEPKPVGRKKIIVPNPLDEFAAEKSLQTVRVKRKIDSEIKDKITKLEKPDFLLVVDFGYIIPDWLLNLPKIHPLNIHPSELPKWRGSSPAQYSLLFGDKQSAVTLMLMNSKLDQGDIVHQEFFSIDPKWTQTDYYSHAFDLIQKVLVEKISELGSGKIKPKPQPTSSPTITAKTLDKKQSFVEWSLVLAAMNGEDFTNNKVDEYSGSPEENDLAQSQLNDLLSQAIKVNKSVAKTLERASKAFSPWPGLWTILPDKKRMKILSAGLENGKLVLKKVQIEGKNPAKWNEVKNNIF